MYERDALVQVMAMTFLIEEKDGLSKHAGVRAAIRTDWREGTPIEVAATHIAASLFADAISRLDAVRRQKIYDQLADWASLTSFPPTAQEIQKQRAVRKDLLSGNIKGEEFIVTRLQLAFLMAQDWLLADKISMQDWKILKSEVYGSLKGYSSEERQRQRLDEIMEDAFGRGGPTHDG